MIVAEAERPEANISAVARRHGIPVLEDGIVTFTWGAATDVDGDGYPDVMGRYDGRDYRIWPGPNSNSFVAHVLREVPELGTTLPPNATGRDFEACSKSSTAPTFAASQPNSTAADVSAFGFTLSRTCLFAWSRSSELMSRADSVGTPLIASMINCSARFSSPAAGSGRPSSVTWRS